MLTAKQGREAIRLANECLKAIDSKPQPSDTSPRWCKLRVVTEACCQRKREQCKTCYWFKKIKKED